MRPPLLPLAAFPAGIARRVLVLAGMLISAVACGQGKTDRIALVGANLIDGTGGPVRADMVVVIYQGKIETVAPREGFKIPGSAAKVDVTGSWIMPGLIDGGGQVAGWALNRYLSAGVTTVRDLHHQEDSILALRKAAAEGSLVSPRIFTAGATIDGAPATRDNAIGVRNADEARRAVDAKAVAGTDFVSVDSRITPELLKAVMDEAGTLSILVTAHLGLTDALTAAKAGVAVIDQLTGVPQAASPAPERFYAQHRADYFAGWNYCEQGWSEVDSTALTRVAEALAQARVSLVPALVKHETWSRLNDPAILTHDDLRFVPDEEVKRWAIPAFIARAGWDDATFAAARASRPRQDLFLRAFRGAGGRIVAGTDAGSPLLVPGWSLHSELELLVVAGLTPGDALLTATRNAAEMLHADSLGQIAPGKVADLVVLEANPLTDIRNTRTIQRVMVRGRLFTSDSLLAGR